MMVYDKQFKNSRFGRKRHEDDNGAMVFKNKLESKLHRRVQRIPTAWILPYIFL
jgi:hypothetical protein